MTARVGDLLKNADQFVRVYNFDEAERQVNKALELEPKNPYVIAYKEKIRMLRVQHEEKLRREEQERRQQEEALRIAREQMVGTEKPEAKVVVSQKDLDRYKELLLEAWREGLPSAPKRMALEKTRTALKISPEVHKALEKEARLEMYVAAVKRAWKQGAITPAKSDTLDNLRRQFSVTSEEHLKVEPKILWEIQERKHTETLFLIDDEKELVQALRLGLQDLGYTVLTATSPEEALRLLKNITPDLILLDVNFPGAKLAGFTLYEEIRKMPEFARVPIIFLTGVSDEESVRMGLQLGADDYITKPFSTPTLVALIEGKLRRYQEIKRA